MIRLPRLAGVLALLLPAALTAQQEGLSKAFDLERKGSYAAAANAYRAILSTKPGDVAALLGLERVLVPLDQSAAMLPAARAALASAPRSGAVYGVALRAWAAFSALSSASRVVSCLPHKSRCRFRLSCACSS